MLFCSRLFKYLSIVLLIFAYAQTINAKTSSEKIYEKLVEDWSTIFPDGNRNAAGPRFFKYIIDQKPSYEEFIQFNKLYCAVSGSLISPDAKPDDIYLNDIDKGGETDFHYKKRIPRTGKLLLFPATWTFPHRGIMPESSDKYIITGWIHDEKNNN